MVEPEIAFADLHDCMDLARDMVQYVIQYVLDTCPQEMEFFNNFYDKGLIERLRSLVSAEFKEVTYTQEILEEHKEEFEYPVDPGVRFADRARAVFDGKSFPDADFCHRLPKGNQGVLYAAQRR